MRSYVAVAVTAAALGIVVVVAAANVFARSVALHVAAATPTVVNYVARRATVHVVVVIVSSRGAVRPQSSVSAGAIITGPQSMTAMAIDVDMPSTAVAPPGAAAND